MGDDALIGDTGFVGGNLARQHAFAGLFNSRTIDRAAGARFETVVCAAAPGSMFEANRAPDRDAARVAALQAQLARIEARRFVLISSIAVLADFAGGDDETTQAFQTDLAYGRNRRALEAFCADRFADCLIVRLPALFGPGLKKNFLFDLLNPVPTMLTDARLAAAAEAAGADGALLRALYTHNADTGMWTVDRAALWASPRRGALEAALTDAGLAAVGFTHPASRYQYYNLARLWADIETAHANGLDVLHLATEPVAAAEVHRVVTGRAMPDTGAKRHAEDMRTRHAALWGVEGPYLAPAARVLDDIAGFAEAARAAA